MQRLTAKLKDASPSLARHRHAKRCAAGRVAGCGRGAELAIAVMMTLCADRTMGEDEKRGKVSEVLFGARRRATARSATRSVGEGEGAEACSSINFGRPGALLGSSVAFGSGCG